MTTETAITSESLKEKTDKQLFRLAKKLGVRDISEETIERDDLINKISLIIEEKNVEKIILGLPIGLKGQQTAQTNRVLEFYNLIKDKNDIQIVMEDERLSSISAKKSLVLQNIKTGHNKDLIDKTAAAIFLQLYLDRK